MAEIAITGLGETDRARWAELWRLYLEFYETQLPAEIYEHTWRRLLASEGPIRGLGARLGGAQAPLAGITHYLFHAHAWSAHEVCYLQDLYVDPAARRHGVGAKLIEAVAAIARERSCLRLYWTHISCLPGLKESRAVKYSAPGRVCPRAKLKPSGGLSMLERRIDNFLRTLRNLS